MHGMPQPLHGSPNCNLQLVGAGPYQAPRGKDFPLHQHITWELTYYRTGSISCPLGNNVFEGRPGVLLATPPRTPHAELATTPYSNYWIQIDAPVDMPWPRICLDDRERSLSHLCTAIVREAKGQFTDQQEMLQLLLRQLDLLLQRARQQQHLSTAERLIQEVEQILEERLATSLTFQEIAREVGVSPSHLRAQFVLLRGHSPKAHLQAIRVREALSLLWNSTLTLEAIAALCGYDSASHLSRHIKRATGKPPGALRGG